MAPSLLLLAAGAAALLLALALAPPPRHARGFALEAGVALVTMAGIALAGSLDAIVITLLAGGVVFAALSPGREFAVRLRPPVLAASLLALAIVLARVQGPELLSRFSAVGLAAGVAAGAGVFPYLHPRDAGGEPIAPAALWTGLIGPILATAVLLHARDLYPPAAGEDLGAILVGLGLINLAWGALGAWWTAERNAAWSHSFSAEWGLALCGFGITVADGRAAALLVFLAMMLGRFPLLFAARTAASAVSSMTRPSTTLFAALLAGSAPFAGFAARVLLLRGAIQLYWPLAVVLVAGCVVLLPASLRLARTLEIPRRRQAAAVALLLLLNAGLGLYSWPVVMVAGS